MRKEIKIGIIVGIIMAVSAIIFFLKTDDSVPVQTVDTGSFSSVKPEAKPATPVTVPVTSPVAAQSPAPASSGVGLTSVSSTTSVATGAPASTVASGLTTAATTPAVVTVKPVTTPAVITKTPAAVSLPTVYQQQTNEPQYHVVKSGDSLTSISVKYYGSSNYWQKILNANNKLVTNANSLRVGWKLRIPSPEEIE